MSTNSTNLKKSIEVTNSNHGNNDRGNGNKKQLKSVAGRRCLTKCHPKGVTYLHPILLTGIMFPSQNTCAIDPVHSKDVSYDFGKELIIADICNPEDNLTHKQPNELDSILLSFYFNPRDFLAIIYNLHSFDEVIYWTLENDYLPYDTIKRVHNCAWKVFGNKVESLTSGVIDYYYDISKNCWLKDYAAIIQRDYSFEQIVPKDSDISDSTDEIYRILGEKFFDYNFLANSLKKYIYEYQDKWDLVRSHLIQIKKYIFDQLITEIRSLSSLNSLRSFRR